ncbi:MAG: VOC family protein [Dongiaceae bacterium]
MVIDHLAVVVRSLEQAIPLWESAFGYTPMTSPVTNNRQKVRVVFLAKSGSVTIKLVEPTDASSAAHALAVRGGGLHHLCFRCANLDDELTRLEQLGMRIVAEAQPGEAFYNEPIAFIYAGQGLNIELIDTDKKAALLPAGN